MDTLLFLIYFVYGLAFWGMGLTLALESGRISSRAERRLLRLLAWFGILHGTHEWLEAYLLQTQITRFIIPAWLDWIRFGLLVTSFVFLMGYGIRTISQPGYLQKKGRLIIPVVIIIYYGAIITSAVSTYKITDFFQLDLLDVLSRYLLAVPGAALASLALQFRSRVATSNGQKKNSRYFQIASIGFGVYALAQFFVHQHSMYPAWFINADTFRMVTGFPIQVIRSLMAITITISLFQATQAAEMERQTQLTEAQRQRVDALERVQEELTKKEDLRRELLRHVVQAQEEERSRIARELHDETAQTLAAFSLDLAAMQMLASDKQECMHLSSRLQEHVKDMSRGLYRLVHDLRPAQLDDLGLVPALQYLVDQDARDKGMSVQFEVKGQVRRLEAIIETVYFRVAQEALTNVFRHAGTKKARILLHYQKQEVLLTVTDLGIGFDPEQLFRPPRGWGIAGMRERVEAIGGQFTIESEPGKGTTVRAVVQVFDLIP